MLKIAIVITYQTNFSIKVKQYSGQTKVPSSLLRHCRHRSLKKMLLSWIESDGKLNCCMTLAVAVCEEQDNCHAVLFNVLTPPDSRTYATWTPSSSKPFQWNSLETNHVCTLTYTKFSVVSNKHACLQFIWCFFWKHVFVENVFLCTASGLGSLALIVYVKNSYWRQTLSLSLPEFICWSRKGGFGCRMKVKLYVQGTNNHGELRSDSWKRLWTASLCDSGSGSMRRLRRKTSGVWRL